MRLSPRGSRPGWALSRARAGAGCRRGRAVPRRRARLSSMVSALSSAVCAVAMASAPRASAVCSRNPYLSLRAASSVPRPFSRAKAATSPRPEYASTPSPRRGRARRPRPGRTPPRAGSDYNVRPRPSGPGSPSARRGGRAGRRESAPPETAQSTPPPGGSREISSPSVIVMPPVHGHEGGVLGAT